MIPLGPATHRALLLVVAVALAYGLATSLRYPSPWAEADTSYFARSISATIDTGTLQEPANPHIYPQGFVYQSWASALLTITGVDVPSYLRVLSPLLGVLFLGVAGLATFIRLMGSVASAVLATLTLFLIPELMFAVLRGNHEKVTLSATLIAALAVLTVIRARERSLPTAGWWSVFLMATVSAVGANAYFGSLLTIALAIVLAAVASIGATNRGLAVDLRPLYRPLTQAVALGALVSIAVFFVLYPPAGSLLRVVPVALTGLTSLIEGLLNGTFSAAAAPYAVVDRDWASLAIYRLLSAVRWLLFATSFGVWIAFSLQSVRHRSLRTPDRVLALALYGAFGLLLAFAIPFDLLDIDLGSNLQVRMYAYFAMFSTPVFALGVTRLYDLLGDDARRRLVTRAVTVLFPVLLVAGHLKAVNDPLVSNVWRFYERNEVQAVRFYLEHQPDRLRTMWVGPDRRLREGFYATYPDDAIELLRFDPSGLQNPLAINLRSGADTTSEFALDTANVRAHIALLDSAPLANAMLGTIVYDNGASVIRHVSSEAASER